MNELSRGGGATRCRCWPFVALAVAPALALLAFQASWPWPFFSDDSFISLRYAERLLDGHGLTWTDGPGGAPERVEGYSNLLWVLLTAGLGALGLEFVAAARLLGAVATALALVFLARASRPVDLRTAAFAAIAPLLVAANQVVLGWTLSGLEGPLVLMLLAWGFSGLARHLLAPAGAAAPPQVSPRGLLALGVPFALACWTRPDAPLWAFVAGAGIAALQLLGSERRGLACAIGRAFWFGLPALVAVVAQLAFRLVYYGDWVPNTAHVKAEFDPGSFGPGFEYVVQALTAMTGLSVLAVLGALLLLVFARPRAFGLVLLLPVLAWFGYLIAIGGDHFPCFRLLHGALAPLALLAALGLRALGPSTGVVIVGFVLAIAAAGFDVHGSRSHAKSHELRHEAWEWHGKALGEVLDLAFPDERPRIAVDAAGALPYFSRLPALDMLGLCDRAIATTPFPGWLDTMKPGTPRPPGHLRGNGDYVMERRPDLMLFQHAPGLPLPVFVSGCEFESDSRFLENYRCVLVDLGFIELVAGRSEPHVAPLWVRAEGKAGIRRAPQRIDVPGYLLGAFALPGPVVNRHQPPTGDPAIDGELAANLGHAARFFQQREVKAVPSVEGPLELALAVGASARLSLNVPAGAWRVGVVASGGTPTLHLSPAPSDPGGALDLVNDAVVTLEVAAGGAEAIVQRVTLERVR